MLEVNFTNKGNLTERLPSKNGPLENMLCIIQDGISLHCQTYPTLGKVQIPSKINE